MTSKGAIQVQCAAKAVSNEEGPPKMVFQGYSGDAVDLSDYGFDHPVVYNISGIKTNQKTPIMYDHSELIGHSTSVRKVDNNTALRGKGVASVPGEYTNKVVEGAKNGFPWQGSMGLSIPNYRDDIVLHDKGTITVNNREFNHPVYVVNKSELVEMTITARGRDTNTSFEFLNQEKRMEIKNASKPDVKDPPTEAVVENTPAPKTEPAPDPAPVEEVVENATVAAHTSTPTLTPEVRRAMSLLNKFPGEWEAIEKGIDNGWDDEAIENSLELKKLNNNLPKPPGPTKKYDDNFNNSLQARMALSFGCQPEFLEKRFGEKMVQNAVDAPALGICELLTHAANASGGNFHGYDDPEAVARYLKNSGYGSFDLPDFFEKVAGFTKDQRWEINAPFATEVCKPGSNPDFRKTQRKRLTGGDVWNEVADDGKLELWGTGNQKKYETELKTYGSIFTMTRQEVINDDMGALNDLMDMMVEGALMIPDYLLGQKMLEQAPASGTFWVDDDNSFDNTALTRTNLSTAFNSIRQYNEVKDRFNWNVMMNEKWSLIVSPNLEETAWELIKQDKLDSTGSTDSRQGTKNYWFGRFDLKVFGQMANTSAFSSGAKWVGNTTWILWPSSQRFAPYEITYYRNQRRPVVENVDMPSTFLGFGTRGYWDVEVNERERTAIHRYTATA
jgi:ribosomal protein S4